eukprot:CAMPEP_0117432108 /NCGR_PEP_ID=MMETSP0758-20121206/11657_1 /TAXON_ID=63605 /ORGANISM="Percolomonas cosmopolitus, Strain AE-1 (ATCC 50343)" /LENGTH=392 /DNA_ID=CAMNT_0005221817 /DNA_START=16 /DNA_END=1191 /DNA_ORIENTATION=-
MQAQKKAHKNYKLGVSTLNRKIGFGNKYKTAAKYFEDAATNYLKVGDFKLAGDSYKQLADCLVKCNQEVAAVNALTAAADQFCQEHDTGISAITKKLSYTKEYDDQLMFARNCLSQAATLIAENSNFLKAAKLEKRAGDICGEIGTHIRESLDQMESTNKLVETIEKRKLDENAAKAKNVEEGELIDEEKDGMEEEEEEEEKKEEEESLADQVTLEKNDIKVLKELREKRTNVLELGTKHYQTAANYYESINAFPNVNDAIIQSANFMMDNRAYKDAAKALDRLLYADWNQAQTVKSRSLLQFTANRIIFLALLSRLCDGVTKDNIDDELEYVEVLMENYAPLGRLFNDSAEAQSITKFIEAFKEKSKKVFTQAVEIIHQGSAKYNEFEHHL